MIKNKINSGTKPSGFTIVELLIASAVFSVVLLVALAGFLQIGRMFHKGTSQAATQDVAKQIMNDISDSLQNAASVTTTKSHEDFQYMCIGNTRYTFKIGRAIKTTETNFSANDKFGLVKDKLPGSNACARPCPETPAPCDDGETRWQSPIEMLGNNMRVQALSVQPNPSISPDYYTVNLVVAYGDDDLLELANSSDPASIRCKGTTRQNMQFCAVVPYSTSLKRGMNF